MNVLSIYDLFDLVNNSEYYCYNKYLAMTLFRKCTSYSRVICGFEERAVYLYLVLQYFINIFLRILLVFKNVCRHFKSKVNVLVNRLLIIILKLFSSFRNKTSNYVTQTKCIM